MYFDKVSNYLPRKPQSLIINIFDALDDYQYREDLLKIAKTIRKVNHVLSVSESFK